MRLLFIVDGRSPIALNWIRYFVENDHEVHLVSMFPCQPELPLASLTVIPVAFSGAVSAAKPGEDTSWKYYLLRSLATPRTRTWLHSNVEISAHPVCALANEVKKNDPKNKTINNIWIFGSNLICIGLLIK